jgi:hypothetical protein
MRRISDLFVLRKYLSRLSDAELTPAQARLMLAARGIRVRQKVVEAALKLPEDDPLRDGLTPVHPGADLNPIQKASLAKPKPRPRPRLKPLDDLPLTPEERAIMERLRRERGAW